MKRSLLACDTNCRGMGFQCPPMPTIPSHVKEGVAPSATTECSSSTWNTLGSKDV
jgi:hypothetical protein